MRVNEVPTYDVSDNPTGCCPRFQPEPWQGQELHFEGKRFVRASTVSVFHVPLNMGSVFARTQAAIASEHAQSGTLLVMSRDDSAWHAEHLFAVDRDVPGAEMVQLSGTFLTHVFEGPFSDTPKWCAEMERIARDKGRTVEALYYFYTTCPKCSRVYGKNYVVGLAKVSEA